MRAATAGLLAALGVVVLGGGWYFSATPSEQTAVAGGKLMFPDLAPRLQDAVRVEITHQGKQTVIEKRPDGLWGIASMHDYPVQEAKLRGMMTGLTELRLTEVRTNDPGQFSRLGLDDPNAAGSSADLLQVLDKAGKPILAVIVGHRRVRSQADVPEEVYVRRPDDNQTWLAEGSLQVDADTLLWLDRNVMNIAHDRIASVVAGDLVFGRADGKFALTQPADHPKLEDYKVEDVARALELLTFQTVRADADAPGVAQGDAAGGAPGDGAWTEAGHSVFTTSDGLAVKTTMFHADKDVWVRFAISADGDAAKAGGEKAGAVKAEAQRLEGRTAGWTYQIGSWKEKSLVPTMDDLKAPEPAKTEPDGTPAGGAPPQSAAPPK